MCNEKFEQFIDFVRIKWNGDIFPGTETNDVVGTIAGIRQQYQILSLILYRFVQINQVHPIESSLNSHI